MDDYGPKVIEDGPKVSLEFSKRELGLLLAALDWYDLAASMGKVKLDKSFADSVTLKVMKSYPWFK